MNAKAYDKQITALLKEDIKYHLTNSDEDKFFTDIKKISVLLTNISNASNAKGVNYKTSIRSNIDTLKQQFSKYYGFVRLFIEGTEHCIVNNDYFGNDLTVFNLANITIKNLFWNKSSLLKNLEFLKKQSKKFSKDFSKDEKKFNNIMADEKKIQQQIKAGVNSEVDGFVKKLDGDQKKAAKVLSDIIRLVLDFHYKLERFKKEGLSIPEKYEKEIQDVIREQSNHIIEEMKSQNLIYKDVSAILSDEHNAHINNSKNLSEEEKKLNEELRMFYDVVKKVLEEINSKKNVA